MSDERTAWTWVEELFERHHSPIRVLLTDIRALLAEIKALLRRPRPTRLVFELPTRTRNGVTMADTPLLNDAVYTISVHALNSGGVVEPLPTGDVFTIANSDPASLGAVMGTDAAGNAAVVLTPLVQAATGISITVTDSGGLSSPATLFDIVADATPTSLVLDIADATHVPQAVPAS